jgi:hypothetical protein
MLRELQTLYDDPKMLQYAPGGLLPKMGAGRVDKEGQGMKKEHSVFITVSGDELLTLVDREARRKGLLRDVKSTVDFQLFEPECEVSVEYRWVEK